MTWTKTVLCGVYGSGRYCKVNGHDDLFHSGADMLSCGRDGGDGDGDGGGDGDVRLASCGLIR